MPIKKLQSLGTYEDITEGAHRKAASILGTPSLVRHLGFWNTEGDDQEARIEKYKKYFELIKIYIESNESDNIKLERDYTVFRKPDVESNAASLIRFWWFGIFLCIRIEFFSEYVTITSIADFSVDGSKLPYASAQETSDIDQISEYIQDLKSSFNKEFCSTKPEAVVEGLIVKFWNIFEDKILNAVVNNVPILEDVFGEMFVDIRGIVTGSEYINADDKGRQLIMRESSKRALPRLRNRSDMVHGMPPSQWARDSLERLWPFLEFGTHPREHEFTASRFLDGRTLFISALGSKPEDLCPEGMDWSPIRFHLHTYTDDEWQIGRLIDRMLTMGTLRLAATMEIEGLKKAGVEVERLTAKIDETATAIETALKDAGNFIESESTDAQKKQFDEQRSRIDDLMKEVGDFRNNMNSHVSGNVYHRLERSNYYFERFNKESTALRARRLEGFQLYQEIVNRRLSGVFGYINLLQARVDEVYAEMSSLNRQYSSYKITQVTSIIGTLVSSMNKQESQIENIQDFGEFALIGFLIPYYLGSSIVHAFPYFKHDPNESLIWQIALIAGAVFTLYKRWDMDRSNSKFRFKIFSLNFVMVIWLIILILMSVLSIFFDLQMPDLSGVPSTHS
jgi:hypothetical protein